jgi:predicted DNA-binding transcriptional regulator AlpA
MVRTNPNAGDAHAQLVLQLCEALSTFVAATVPEKAVRYGPAFDLSANDSANDNAAPHRVAPQYDDVISLRGLLLEFGLKQPQVLKLRKNWGFPAPIGRARPVMFRRMEVERWARSQPNQNNLAIALRSRTRRR